MKIFSPACDYLSFSFDSLYLEQVLSMFLKHDLYYEVLPDGSLLNFHTLSSRSGSGRFGYDSSTVYYYDDFVCFTLLHGGHNHERPTIISSGRRASSTRRALCYSLDRYQECTFKINRIDIAIDFINDDFERLAYLLDVKSESMGIKSSVAGDFMRGVNGRTLYLGSRQSRFFFRLYEKGIESSGIKNHIRAELEIKCKDMNTSNQILPYVGDLNKLLAFWRFSPYMCDVIGFSDFDVPRETIKSSERFEDIYSSLFYMHRNYSLLFKKMSGLLPLSDVTDFMLSSNDDYEDIQDVKNFFDSRY